MNIFRDLNEEEEVEFRQWARDNYEPFSEVSTIWHPVVRDECIKINKEISDIVEETEVIATGYVLTPEEHTESLQLLKDLRESIPENKQKSVKRLIELLVDKYGNSI